MNKHIVPVDDLSSAASFAASLRRSQLPDAVVERAKLVLMDMIGVMLKLQAAQRSHPVMRSNGTTWHTSWSFPGKGGRWLRDRRRITLKDIHYGM